MNIVILSRGRFPGFDGPYKRTKLIGAGLAKNGCDVTLIVAYPPEWKKCDREFIKKNRYCYYHTLKAGPRNQSNLSKNIFYKLVGTFKVIPLFNKIANKKKVDVLFLYGLGFLELLVAYLLKRKYKIIIAIDKTDVNYQFYKDETITFWRRLLKMSPHEMLSGLNIAFGEYFIKNHVDVVFTVCSFLYEKYSGKTKGIVRMTNPALIESEAYNDDADLLDLSSNRSSTKLMSVSVTEGYFYGLFPFIEALGKLKSQYHFHLYILGSDKKEYLNTLNAKLVEHGIHDRSTILYKISDEEVISLYLNADILLLAQASTQLAEGGFPSKLSEYLISGKPFITTLFSDFKNYLIDGKNCLIVPHGNIKAYEHALQKLFKSKSLSAELGREARKTALYNFDYIHGMKNVMENLTEVLN